MKSKKITSLTDNFRILLNLLFANKGRIILFIIVLAIFIALSVFSYYTFIKPGLDKKHILNKEFIKPNVDGNKENITIIMFGTEWCPYCKKAKPEWDKFSNYVKNFNSSNDDYEVLLKYIDCDQDTKIAEKYNITGYPTIKLLKDKNIYDYDAKPNKDTLIQFLESYI
tara:strand:- start:1870 stop:2373 length:504 start_codon:yes stop_codon:yes gene_type:complete